MSKEERAAQLAAQAAAAMVKESTANQALGDGAILQLLIMLFKELLPILLELLKDD